MAQPLGPTGRKRGKLSMGWSIHLSATDDNLLPYQVGQRPPCGGRPVLPGKRYTEGAQRRYSQDARRTHIGQSIGKPLQGLLRTAWRCLKQNSRLRHFEHLSGKPSHGRSSVRWEGRRDITKGSESALPFCTHQSQHQQNHQSWAYSRSPPTSCW